MTITKWLALRDFSAYLEPGQPDANGAIAAGALHHCLPFTQYNRLGAHVCLPFDLEFIWKGGSDVEYTIRGVSLDQLRTALLSSVSGEKFRFIDKHTDFGSVLIQLWTGIIVKSPPGTSCIVLPANNENRSETDPLVQSGIIETSWFRGELHLNLNIRTQNKRVTLKRGHPIAKLLIVPEEIPTLQLFEQTAEDAPNLEQEWREWMHLKNANAKTAYQISYKNNKKALKQ